MCTWKEQHAPFLQMIAIIIDILAIGIRERRRELKEKLGISIGQLPRLRYTRPLMPIGNRGTEHLIRHIDILYQDRSIPYSHFLDTTYHRNGITSRNQCI